MISFIAGDSEDDNGKFVGRFWENSTGIKLSAPYSVIGIVKNTKLEGMVLFDDYTYSSIEVHYSGNKCLSRSVIRYVLGYVFNQLNCNVLRIRPHSRNEESIDLVKRLGFEYEGILDKYYSLDDHGVMYKMYREQANKWIKLNGRT